MEQDSAVEQMILAAHGPGYHQGNLHPLYSSARKATEGWRVQILAQCRGHSVELTLQ
ncbi:MAG: hypothetical protein Aurels2KO_57590 [Aureliella sp.]